MNIFRPFEEQVLDLLLVDVLTPENIISVKQEGTLLSYDYTGCGYFLSVTHPCLPAIRTVCHTPVVLGKAQDITSGFVVFIEKGHLTLECHSIGEPEVPEHFRDFDVHVSAA